MKENNKDIAEKNWQEYFLENYGLHIFPAFEPEKEICVWNDSTLRIHKKNDKESYFILDTVYKNTMPETKREGYIHRLSRYKSDGDPFGGVVLQWCESPCLSWKDRILHVILSTSYFD